jgi:hypothetical protein
MEYKEINKKKYHEKIKKIHLTDTDGSQRKGITIVTAHPQLS